MENKNIVDYVANLARVEVSPEEKAYLGGQLSKILEYIEALKQADVSGVEPLRGMHLDQGLTRQDAAEVSPHRRNILANAPAKEENSFKIPKVIE